VHSTVIFRTEQVQPFHCAEDLFPLAEVEQRWSAAAEKIVLGLRSAATSFEFADKRGDVAVDEVAAGRLGIKGAIRAFLARKTAHEHRGSRRAARWNQPCGNTNPLPLRRRTKTPGG